VIMSGRQMPASTVIAALSTPEPNPYRAADLRQSIQGPLRH
jgi:hypothetical protein